MPKLELQPLTPEAEALAARVGELLKNAKIGETVTLPPDLAQAINDSVREATAPAILARRRMEWLHSRDACNVGGYEWGIFRVKWENGRAVEVWQTNGDFSDLDGAMGAAGVTGTQAPDLTWMVPAMREMAKGLPNNKADALLKWASAIERAAGVMASDAPHYWCNKCGYSGPVQTGHKRPFAEGECGYMAVPVPPAVGVGEVPRG